MVFFGTAGYDAGGGLREKIDRLLSIDAEIEQIADRGNSRLKSRARISDGPGHGASRHEFAPPYQSVTMAHDNRVGVTGTATPPDRVLEIAAFLKIPALSAINSPAYSPLTVPDPSEPNGLLR
jgi:hypothetical protein